MGFTENLDKPSFRALIVFRSGAAARRAAMEFCDNFGAEVNLSMRRVRLRTGAVVLFGVIDSDADLYKFAGLEFQHIEFAEQPATDKVVEALRPRAREWDGIPGEFVEP